MNPLLLGVLMAGLIEPTPHTRAIERTRPGATTTGRTVVVVADGSRSRSGAESAAALDRLRSHLGSGWSVRVAWFDAETPPRMELSVAEVNRDLVLVQPRTPMKETVSLTLGRSADRGSVSDMVVIAHEQVSPTYVRTDQLISSLIHSEVRVHTIHLSEQNQHKGIFRRLGRAVTAGTVWVAEALIEEDRQEYSSEETARMLRAMSDETGGIACSAVDAKAALGCAETIAARINESTRSGAGDLSTADSGRKP